MDENWILPPLIASHNQICLLVLLGVSNCTFSYFPAIFVHQLSVFRLGISFAIRCNIVVFIRIWNQAVLLKAKKQLAPEMSQLWKHCTTDVTRFSLDWSNQLPDFFSKMMYLIWNYSVTRAQAFNEQRPISSKPSDQRWKTFPLK